MEAPSRMLPPSRVLLPRWRQHAGVALAKMDYAALTAAIAVNGWVCSDLGASVEADKHLFRLTLGNPSEKPTLYIQAGIHGNEWRSTHYALAFASMLTDPEAPNRELLDAVLDRWAIVMIPCVNPSGYIAASRTNAAGVDLNRNYPTGWETTPEGAGTPNYKGPAPLSEPEAAITATEMEAAHPVAVICCHMGGWVGYPAVILRDAPGITTNTSPGQISARTGVL